MKHELATFARELGVSTTGDKPILANRVAAVLAGETAEGPSRRTTMSRPLPRPLTLTTELPAGQSASQQLRPFFVDAVGPSFRYDIHMRTFLSSNRTKTLGEAVDHWHATRGTPKPDTLPQLELVRFTKDWHLANPLGTASQCRAAWKIYRSLPVDGRPGVSSRARS